ncbi:MAG: SRPBCC family protein [Cyanobacteria bacterium P01_E01_bin.34]
MLVIATGIRWLAIAILSLLAIGFALPDHVHVEREITISATPDRVFALVGDLQQWDAWSPWAKIDPDAHMHISGSGLGQTMVWSSQNPEVGSGSQMITELEESRYLHTHLEFDGQGQADATISLESTDDGTRVTWALDSDMRQDAPVWMAPASPYLGLMVKASVGRSYETGLQNLKTAIEQQ